MKLLSFVVGSLPPANKYSFLLQANKEYLTNIETDMLRSPQNSGSKW